MSKRENESQPVAEWGRGERVRAGELSRILQKRVWSPPEAEQVLLAQKESGLSVAGFAKRHGFSKNRLFYWSKRLQASGAASSAVPETHERSPTAPQALELEAVERALREELCAEAAGDQKVQAYVLRAVCAEPRMWSVYEVRAEAWLLWCVVKWVGWRGPTPYALVALDRRAPALRWREYQTLQQAQEALRARDRRRRPVELAEGVPLLVPVQVRGTDGAQPSSAGQGPPRRPTVRAVTVHFPSGVRIRIGNGTKPELVQAVRRAMTGGVP